MTDSPSLRARVLALALLLLAAPAHSAERSSAVRAAFQRAHPCPSTGKTTGACPNYVADHRVPRCANGPDTTANLRWSTVEEALAKDDTERRLCAALRRLEKLEATCPKS